jgi:ketosteroid isomerase-like protein
MVSMPRDETLIRNLRTTSNAAIAVHAVDGIVATMENSVVITRGSGGRITGIAEVRASFTEAFSQSADLVYIRAPDRVDVSTSEPLAAEHGTWVGRWTAADHRAATANGTYVVMWRKTTSPPDGSPEWKIRSEVYVTLGRTNCR